MTAFEYTPSAVQLRHHSEMSDEGDGWEFFQFRRGAYFDAAAYQRYRNDPNPNHFRFRSHGPPIWAIKKYAISFPLWVPTVVFGALATWGASLIRRNCCARTPTACKSCGYDLRAGNEKCTECGAASHILPKSVAKTEPAKAD
jgi:hypothetical protein